MQLEILLTDVLDISTGYPFRKKIEPVHKGVPVIQLKDVDMREGLNAKDLIVTELPYRAPSEWVKNEDILFIAKGSQHFAVLVKGLEEQAVCTPHFFHLRVKSNQILPAYIVWLINQTPMQQYLIQVSEGNYSKLIKKSSLENISLKLPDLAIQEEIVGLHELYQAQAKTLKDIHIKHIIRETDLANHSMGEK
ncbi:restriction endonuclease subunit S [Methylophaga sp.]|uniref:restriction endonuclease subunit S n=1 Tax=Methylophaga sp. TaxID=2024840 RepID=UPI003A93A2F5